MKTYGILEVYDGVTWALCTKIGGALTATIVQLTYFYGLIQHKDLGVTWALCTKIGGALTATNVQLMDLYNTRISNGLS